MPTTITAARLVVLRSIIDHLRRDATLAGVTVWPGWPADSDVTSEMLWAGELTGDCDIPVLTGADTRQRRSDNWQIDWYSRVVGIGAATPDVAIDATHDRIAVLHGAIETLVTEDPTVDLTDCLIDAVVTRNEHGVTVTNDGPIGFGHIVLACESRLD